MPLTIHQSLALRDNYVHLVVCEDTGDAALVDPSEVAPALELLAKAPKARLKQIWCTHHHWDHVGGVVQLKAEYPEVLVFGSRYDVDNGRIPEAARGLDHKERFTLGTSTIEARSIPGHTLGHMALRAPVEGFAFVGDTLFAGGCGRLFEGSPEQMTDSLYEVMGDWPDSTLIYCGHEYTESNLRFAVSVDPHNSGLLKRQQQVAAARKQGLSTVPSTMGEERRTNPFLRCTEPPILHALGLSGQSRSECFGALRSRKDNFS